MSVVDLSGRPVSGEVQDDRAIVALIKRLLAEIESGELIVEDFYLMVESDNGKTIRSFDSGLTLMQAVLMLEREKFRILCMAEGVKL